MKNILKYKKNVYYKCSSCGYIIEEIIFEVLKYEIPCPKCNKGLIKDFDKIGI